MRGSRPSYARSSHFKETHGIPHDIQCFAATSYELARQWRRKRDDPHLVARPFLRHVDDASERLKPTGDEKYAYLCARKHPEKGSVSLRASRRREQREFCYFVHKETCAAERITQPVKAPVSQGSACADGTKTVAAVPAKTHRWIRPTISDNWETQREIRTTRLEQFAPGRDKNPVNNLPSHAELEERPEPVGNTHVMKCILNNTRSDA